MKKILAFSFLIAFLVLVIPSYAMSPLHVDGKYIKNETGDVVVLRGVNKVEFADDPDGIWMSNTAWNDDNVKEELDEIATWGANVVRYHLNVEDWKYDNDSPHATLNTREALRRLVDFSEERDLYVVLDGYRVLNYWNGGGQDPLPYPPYSDNGSEDVISNEQDFIDFWVSIANEFKDNDNVIFEFWNEPYGSDEAETSWFNVTQQTIDAVRATGAENLIIFQWRMAQWVNLNYPNDSPNMMDWVIEADLNDTLDNIVYSTHFYRFHNHIHYSLPTQHRAWNLSDCDAALEAMGYYEVIEQYPLFIGEIGAAMTYTGEDLEQEIAWFNNTLYLFEEHGISYVAFWWRNIGIFPMINGDLSPNAGGDVLLSHLNGTAAEITSHLSGTLSDNGGSPVESAISAYQTGTDNLMYSTSTGTDGSYSLSMSPGVYDIEFDFSDVRVRFLSVDADTDISDLIKEITFSSNRLSFVSDDDMDIRIYGPTPSRVLLNSSEIASNSTVHNNTYYYSNGMLNLKVTSDLKSDCIYQCCENEERYRPKACVSGTHCYNRECVSKQECPYECCSGDLLYFDKSCSEGYCYNHECRTGSVTFGNTDVGEYGLDNGWGKSFILTKQVVPSDALIINITHYMLWGFPESYAKGVIFSHDQSNDRPGSLLAEGSEFEVIGSGWHTSAISYEATAGQVVWIGIYQNESSWAKGDNSTSDRTYIWSQGTYSDVPMTYDPVHVRTYDHEASSYATYIPA